MATLAAALAVTACQTLGSGSVSRDRLGYAGAIAESWKELILLNIVKQRYLDMPVYLDESSVISSYSLSTDVNMSATKRRTGLRLGGTAAGRRVARQAAGLSQVELPKRVSSDQSIVSRLERGTSMGTPELLRAVGKELKVTVSQLPGEQGRVRAVARHHPRRHRQRPSVTGS